MDEFEVDASRLVGAELDRLRVLSHIEAKSLPDVRAVDICIAQKTASLTIFRYYDADVPDDHVLVFVLAARAQFLGMASRHLERGLVFAPIGPARDATTTELENSGG